jgi:hypothetical protein
MEQATIDALKAVCAHLNGLAGAVRTQTHQVVSTNDHVQVIRHYDNLRKLNAIIKETREALSSMEERLSREYVPDVMRSNNIKSTTIEGVGRVSLSSRWSASMLEKESGMAWLRESDNDGVIQETVNAQTLGALAKELNNQGIELPKELFKTSVMTFTSITKA